MQLQGEVFNLQGTVEAQAEQLHLGDRLRKTNDCKDSILHFTLCK